MRTSARPWVATLALALFPQQARAAEGGLQIVPEPVLLLILIALFVALRFVLEPLLFRPLVGVLEERRARIEGAREEADQIGRRAEEILARYRSELRSTHEEAEGHRRDHIEEARAEQRRVTTEAREVAEGEIENARRQIQGALAEARGGLRGSAEELARAAATQILGRNVA